MSIFFLHSLIYLLLLSSLCFTFLFKTLGVSRFNSYETRDLIFRNFLFIYFFNIIFTVTFSLCLPPANWLLRELKFKKARYSRSLNSNHFVNSYKRQFLQTRVTRMYERQVSFAGHRSQVTGHRSQVTGHRSQVTMKNTCKFAASSYLVGICLFRPFLT